MKSACKNRCLATILLAICLIVGAPLWAQQKVVHGVVEDLEGNPMPGVSVTIEGTTIGTITDVDGKYEITTQDGKKLVFSFVGMKSEKVEVGKKSVINIRLKEDAVMLQEVVAIGYGTKTRATTTGAVDLVNSDKLMNRPVTNTAELLQGVVPGMEIRRTNQGKVGEEGYSIQVRGVTSRSDPGILVVVDGIPYKDNNADALNKINPQDIENITILKDAQAAIYGARAAGGVLLVTTKKGKSEKPTINYTGNFTFNTPASVPQKVNVLQHIEMMGELYANDGITNHFFTHLLPYVETADIYSKNPQVVKGPFGDTPDLVLGWHDWWDEMYGTAFDHSHNLSISGGSEKSNYYASIGYLDQGSMFNYGEHNNKKYWGRFKYEYNVNKYIKLRSNVYVGRKKVTEPYNIDHLAWLTYWTWNCQPTYNPQGEYYASGGFGNPIAYAQHTGNKWKTYYSYYTQLGFDITPIKNLTITGDMSLNYDITDEKYYRKRHQTYHWDGSLNYDVIDYWEGGKTKTESLYGRNEHIVTSLHANYNFNITDKHMFNAMFGASHEELDSRGFNAYRYNLITDELPILGLGDAEQQYNDEYSNAWAITSIFGRLSYNWDNRVFVEATYRNDGSSKFAKGHKWEDFWGVSGSWIISNENFFTPAKNYLNNLKIRLSWGQLGNQAGIGLYDHYQYIFVGGQYPFGDSNNPLKVPNASLGGMPAVDRTWETIETYNAGVDFGLLNNRLNGTFDYFIKDNKNMFYAEEFPTILGTSAPSINGAHVRTNGWELTLNWKDKIGKVGYRLGVSLSDNKTKVVSLSDSRNPGHGLNAFVEGYPTNAFFIYEFDGFIKDEADLADYKSKMKGGIPTNLRVGDAKYVDKDGDGILEPTLYKEGDSNSGDIVYKGTHNQRYLYGINLGLDWKGIDFSAFLQGVGKWNCINGTYAGGGEVWKQSSKYFYHNTWSTDRPNAEYPRLTQDGGIQGNNYMWSTAPYKYFNNRYLRLKEVQIGYTFPTKLTKKFGVENLRIYATGMNLFEWDNLPDGFDPEAPYNENLIPFSRTYSIGVNVQF